MVKPIQAKNSLEIKKTNRAVILNLLLQNQGISRTELAKLSGLSSPTVTNIINEFLETGLVEQGNLLESNESRSGRRRRRLVLNSNARVVLAIHLGIPDAAIGLVDLKGQLLARESISLDLVTPRSAENLAAIIQQTKDFIADQTISPEQLLGVGVGFPNLPDDTLPIAEIFQQTFDVPVIVENNVLAMTLGEYVFGLNQSVLSVVYLYVGMGIGAGSIINGELWRGARGNAGHEIAHMQVTDGETTCRCGNRGCLETVAAQPAIAAQVRARFPEVADNDDFSLVDYLIEMALQDEPDAIALLEQVGQNLYPAIAALINIIDPELIVIGGRLTQAKSILFEKIYALMADRARSGMESVVELKASSLGEKDCGLVGAASLVLMTQFYAPEPTSLADALVTA